MENTLEKSITIEEIETTGLKVMGDGWKDYDDANLFVQLCDEEGILDDDDYVCHYEILKAKMDVESASHCKDKVYVEIHIEDKKLKNHFDSLFQFLANENEKLEKFTWQTQYIGLRFKNREFDITEKDKILETLKELKQLTIDPILKTFREAKEIINFKQDNEFILGDKNRTTSDIKHRSELYSEAKVFFIIHESIKKNLINKLKQKTDIIYPNDPIDINKIYEEHIVNGTNYIDLVAQTQSGKIIFFEIKTKNDARICIREALGQLMEYSYFPDKKHADKLVVVGSAEKTTDTNKYIQLLNDKHNIPITYLQIRR